MCHLQDNSHFVCFVLISLDRFTFWLTFLQSYIPPFFLTGLLSYLVEMKMRTSRHVVCKRDNSHCLHNVLISLDIRGLPFG